MYEQQLKQYLPFFLKKDHQQCYEIFPGKGRVMVSAPHSVEQTRNQALKFGEYQTGVIARILHDLLHCPVIYKTRNCNDGSAGLTNGRKRGKENEWLAGCEQLFKYQ